MHFLIRKETTAHFQDLQQKHKHKNTNYDTTEASPQNMQPTCL